MSRTNPTPTLLKRLPYLLDVPVIGIIRGYDTQAAVTAARVVGDRGIRVLEVTLGTENALETIYKLSDLGGLVIGVGTVTIPSEVTEAAAAGAEFVVTPIFDREVVEASLAQGLPIICGAATPTEIHRALSAGATAAKVFPVKQLGGPEYVRAVLAPLSQAPLIPTGGVDTSNASAYLDAGAIALAAGGTLFPARIARENDWSALDDIARNWMESVS